MTKLNNRACALIGLSNININLKTKYMLEGIFNTLISQQYKKFLLCENNTFDALCYNTLQTLKNNYPQIKLTGCTTNNKRIYDDNINSQILNEIQKNKTDLFYFIINNSDFIIFSSKTNNNTLLKNLINYCKQIKKTFLVL